jgi:hypothetical protein
MKKIMLFCFISIGLFFIAFSLKAGKEIKIEVLYMNHGPIQPSLEQLRQILSKYGNKITVSWYDFESKEGEQFMAKKGINQHIPLTIWIDGKSKVPVKGKDINFTGFPSGSGPAFFQGKWTMDDLRNALDQATDKK